MPADAVVRARIDLDTKERAAVALEAMGPVDFGRDHASDAPNCGGKKLPFDVRVPNAETQTAMRELERGKGKRFESPEAAVQGPGTLSC